MPLQSKHVFIAPRSFDSITGSATAMLEAAGCTLSRWEGQGRPDEAAMCAALADMDALIVGLEPVSARALDAAPRLRIVAKYGVGLDNIDLEAARARGVSVTWTSGASTNAVAELAVVLMMSLLRRVPTGDRITRGGGWGKVVGVELSSKTVGLVGLGRIGRRTAALLAGFGVTLLAHDPYHTGFAARHNITYVSIEDLLAYSDVVSLHCPLFDATRPVIGAAELARMRPTAYLVNTARGALVDEAALAEALKSGKLAGAAVDVYTSQPPTGSPLLGLDNVIATPHMGAHTQEAINEVSRQSAENVIAVLDGKAPPYPVPGFE